MYSVLLIDPNPHTIKETSALILSSTADFYIEHSVSDFDAAIKLLKQQHISLVIINIRNFVSSGIVLCSRIRQLTQVPIILLGGKIDFSLARKAVTYQISDYLVDPLTEKVIAASLSVVFKQIERDASLATSTPAIDVQSKKNEATNAIINTVKQYVQDELHNNITLKKISRKLHFNCAYLGQKFKLYENMSFNEYLLQQRMEKAKQLLKKTDLKIYEIANEIGYSEIDWFYKKFKAYTGTSANEYRKKMELSRAN